MDKKSSNERAIVVMDVFGQVGELTGPELRREKKIKIRVIIKIRNK